MRFKRYGKSYQMVIENGCDLKEALSLDEALWGAVSAPSSVFICDPKLIELLDEGAKGRITSTDIRNAIKWLLEQIPDHASIVQDFSGNLPLKAITDQTQIGKDLIASAVYILNELAAEDKNNINLTQIRTFLTTVTTRSLNGDGVLTLKSTADPQILTLITDVVTATGGAKDLDGSMGLADKELNTFLTTVPAYLDWLAQGTIPEGQTSTPIKPMGEDTAALDAMVQANAPKIDQFFKLCKLLDFDSRIQPKALSPDAKVAAFDPAKSAEVDAYENDLPLSTPRPDAMLYLDNDKINPAYRASFQALRDKVLKPVLGDAIEAISQDDWAKVRALFAPFEAYMAGKKGGIVEKIPVDRLRGYMDCAPLIEEVKKLMVIDKGVADTVKAAKEVERLLLYRAFLLRIANNFICFSELYNPNIDAMFEYGRVVIDGRWFNVALKVDAIPAHVAMAKLSQMFLIYMEVQTSPTVKTNIVLPVTSGSKGNLVVGKKGVFYDLKGQDYDAKIVQIQENPVCITEALLAPLYRLWGIVEGKITAWSGSAEKTLQTNFTKAITPTAAPAAPAPAAQAKPEAGKMNSNAFLGIGVACAAIGSSLAFISKTISGMSGFQIWMSVIVAILALMLPISIIAIIKLNRQDLSSILEGCGWGINLRLRLDTKLRNQFTNFGKYPKDAQGTPRSYRLRVFLILVMIVLCCYGGCKFYKDRQEQKAIQAEQLKKEAEAKKAAEDKAKEAAAKPAPAPAAAPAAPAPAPAAAK